MDRGLAGQLTKWGLDENIPNGGLEGRINRMGGELNENLLNHPSSSRFKLNFLFFASS